MAEKGKLTRRDFLKIIGISSLVSIGESIVAYKLGEASIKNLANSASASTPQKSTPTINTENENMAVAEAEMRRSENLKATV